MKKRLSVTVGYWTFDICQEEALKYSTKKAFLNGNRPAYKASYKQNWLNEICSHMEELVKPNGYWSYEKCKEESLNYTNRTMFRVNSGGAYNSARRKGWLDEICSHMNNKITKPKGYWTYEKCKEEALKYTTRTEFAKKSKGAYKAVYTNDWLDDFFTKKPTIAKHYWTYEKCKELSLECETRTKFKNKNWNAHEVSNKNGWLDEFFPKNSKTTKQIIQKI